MNYERALKMDPSYKDARYNLDFTSNFVQDKIEPVPEFILKTFAQNVSRMFASNTWAWLFIVFLALTLVMVVIFIMALADIEAFSASVIDNGFVFAFWVILSLKHLFGFIDINFVLNHQNGFVDFFDITID